MKFVKNAVPSFDKQGVIGSSPVSPILSYKHLGKLVGSSGLEIVKLRVPGVKYLFVVLNQPPLAHHVQ